MIISASRRTDIPAYYSEWFFNRINEGFVLVRNPMNFHHISQISLAPDVVDGIVIWTKNPGPMLNRIKELEKYNYYFQFTVNPYGKDVEPCVPSKKEVIIPIFKKLSERIGKERIVWRYDPILFNDYYTFDYHCKYFKTLATMLAGYTEKCTISFLDFYKNTERNIKPLNIKKDNADLQIKLILKLNESAKENGIYIDTCAEYADYEKFGISHAHCIDQVRLERNGGYKLSVEKDPNQRPECGCIASIDIGAYNTCNNGCLYCYANFSKNTVIKNSQKHNPSSPLLFGEVGPDDIIKDRKMKSCKICQTSFFD